MYNGQDVYGHRSYLLMNPSLTCKVEEVMDCAFTEVRMNASYANAHGAMGRRVDPSWWTH